MKKKYWLSLPYQLIAVLLVGSALLMGLVFAVGIPANVIYLFQ